MRANRPILACLLALTCLMPAAVVAKAITGEPMLRHFSAEDTKATPTHLAITTGVNGELFVGNIEGVLRHDGVDWLITPLPGRSPGRSLAKNAPTMRSASSRTGSIEVKVVRSRPRA